MILIRIGMRSAEEALRECASVEVADDGAGSAWQEVLTADGTTYYYNAHSGETSWEKVTIIILFSLWHMTEYSHKYNAIN